MLDIDDRAGELIGYGPIPASMARRIAADPTGTWRRLVFDPAKRLIDASRTYRPPAPLRQHVVSRDRTCRFPGCRRNAERCELDHVRAFPDRPTCLGNLHALCPRHHHLKHEAPGWTVYRSDDGTTHWRTPTGTRIEKPPDELPDFGCQVA